MKYLCFLVFFAAQVASAQQNQPGQLQMQIPLPGQAGRAAPNSNEGALPPGANSAKSGINTGRNSPAQAGHPSSVRNGQMGQPIPSGTDPFAGGQNVPTAPVSQIFTSEGVAGVDALLTEEIIRSLRDPFSPPPSITKKEVQKSELENFALKDFHLNGVITGPKKVRAMLTAPNSKVYFVAVGEKIGLRQGRVTAIQSDLIKVVEYETDDRGRRTPEIFEIRLTGEIVSLSKKEEL